MERVLEQLIEDLEDITFGRHRLVDCPVAEEGDGHCDTCHVLDQVIEAVNDARNRIDRVRLGIAA